tara:strand:- start:1325 stop:2620 length:1296 start_codon:yes stop_codon:yes gene_type:complete
LFKQLLAYRNLLFILILLNSGIFFLTDNKKAGIPFMRELYLFGIIIAAGMLLLMWKRVYQSKTSLWILFLGGVVPLSSAILTNLNYGQPLLYGLLEERRSLLYLSFFPTLYLLIKTAPTQKHLETYFLYSAVLCGIVGFLYYFGIIPENTGISFHVDEKDFVETLRPNRYMIGSAYVSIAVFMLLYSMRDRVSITRLGLLLFFAAYLWLVIQTRQTMVIWALAALWIFRNRIGSLLKLGSLASAILAASFFLVPEFYVEQYERFNALLFDATSGPGVRDNTVAVIMQAVQDNYYVGLGALSLQWNGGFSGMYGPHFYLSDVGIIGVYHRFGFLTPFVALIFYGGYLWIMRQCKHKGPLLLAFQLTFWFGMLNMLLSNALMYGGATLGIAAACFVYFAKARNPASEQGHSIITPSNNWAIHDQLQHRHHNLE